MKLNRLHYILATIFTLMGVVAGILLNSPASEAAFGTSPPWVKNDHMLPGTTFEQIINLSRSEVDTAMQASVKISGDKKLTEWITIENQDKLIIQKGQSILPMKVIVKVPQRAEIRNYKGGIYVTLSPVKSATLSGGEVAITLGAHITVDITVIGEKITDYQVRSIDVVSLQAGEPFTLKMEVENLGNTEINKLEGKVDIYNNQGTEVVKSLDFVSLTNPISPDETSVRRMVFQNVILEPGQYWIEAKASKDGEIVYENRLGLEVKEKALPVLKTGSALTEKPALPGTVATTENGTNKELTTTPPIVVQIPSSDLKAAAPANDTGNAYLIFGLAGFGLGLIALIGTLVVLVMVLRNQQQLASGQPPAQNSSTPISTGSSAEEKK